MFGRGSLANLAKEHNFAKLKLSKHHMHMQYYIQFAKLFCQNIYQFNFQVWNCYNYVAKRL